MSNTWQIISGRSKTQHSVLLRPDYPLLISALSKSVANSTLCEVYVIGKSATANSKFAQDLWQKKNLYQIQSFDYVCTRGKVASNLKLALDWHEYEANLLEILYLP